MRTLKKSKSNIVVASLILALLVGFVMGVRPAATSARADAPGDYMSDYASQAETQAAERAINQEIANEGMVLLKNEDVLPLKTRQVTIMGNGIQRWVAAGTGSGATSSSNPQTPLTALEQAGISYTQAYNTNGAVSMTATGTSAPAQPTAAQQQEWASSEAAIVFISRSGGENISQLDSANYNDLRITGVASPTGHILQLDNNERALLKIANDNFEKVIVVLNAANAMELDELEDKENYPNVKAALWVGMPGDEGYNAFGRILTGEVNPSGHLVDTLVRDLRFDPTWYNYGNNSQTGGNHTFGSNYAVFYEEGIYVGYKYYETRAKEYKGSITTSTGLTEPDFDNGEDWYNYSVMYPFGHGLSYTTFDWDIMSMGTTSNELPITSSSKIKIKVKVTNTGAVAGKDVVQLYSELPYTPGGIEKSAKNLVDFGKTKLLQPGESDVITLEVDPYDIASYDYNDANKNGFKGYEVEAGKYIFHVSTDSHNTKYNKDGEKLAISYNVENGILITNDPKTGYVVDNAFDDVSESFHAHATALTRADMEGTFPVPPTTAEKVATADETALMNEANLGPNAIAGTNSNAYINNRFSDVNQPYYTTEMPAYGVTPTGGLIMLAELTGKSYDDPLWDTFISQLTITEMYDQIRDSSGAYGSPRIQRLGVPQSTNQDGPLTLNKGVPWVSEPVLAATWNKELAYRQGRSIGNEGLWRSVEVWYAPGLNTHRSAFGARNFEYYSEDAILAGKLSAQVVTGCQEKGLTTTLKHYAMNEQETTRGKIGTFATEQAMREIYLKAFELPVKAGSMGMMSSFNYVGGLLAPANYSLCTETLRNEWGFVGFMVTDYGAGPSGVSSGRMDLLIRAGNDRGMGSGNPSNSGNAMTATQIAAMQKATKNMLYVMANGMAMQTRRAQTDTSKFAAIAYRKPTLTYNNNTFALLTEEEYMENIAIKDGSNLGNDVTYTITEGTLPKGLTLSEDGMISGKARQEGSFVVTVTATTENNVIAPASAEITFNVTATRIDYDPKTMLNGKEGYAYNDHVASAVGGEYVYTLSEGNELPEGLVLAEDGTITGTPSVNGEFSFEVTATSESATLTRTFTIYIASKDAVLTYGSFTAPMAKVGNEYSVNVAKATGSDSITYSLDERDVDTGLVPDGLTLENGILSGVPTTAGRYSFHVIASAPNYDDVKAKVVIVVAEENAVLEYEDATLVGGKVGKAYNSSVADATGSTDTTYALAEGSELPLGLNLSADGTISGTPVMNGTYTFTINASAPGFETVSAEYTVTIEKGTFYFNGKTLTECDVFTAYSADISIDMDGVTYTIKSGSSLPEGLSLNPATGKITGAPSCEDDVYTFTVVAKAEGYEDVEATFTIAIIDPKLESCGGFMGAGSVLAIFGVLGAAAFVALKKKEN